MKLFKSLWPLQLDFYRPRPRRGLELELELRFELRLGLQLELELRFELRLGLQLELGLDLELEPEFGPGMRLGFELELGYATHNDMLPCVWLWRRNFAGAWRLNEVSFEWVAFDGTDIAYLLFHSFHWWLFIWGQQQIRIMYQCVKRACYTELGTIK